MLIYISMIVWGRNALSDSPTDGWGQTLRDQVSVCGSKWRNITLRNTMCRLAAFSNSLVSHTHTHLL